MFSEDLKEFTRHDHQQVEKKLVAQIKAIRSLSDYVDLLELMYGFYVPIHECTRPLLAQGSLPYAYGLREAGALLDDIEHFTGQRPRNLPVCQIGDIPRSFHAALGYLYVTEGSTLGGKYIAEMVAQKLGLPKTPGFHFFNAYGDETIHRWERFKKILDGEFSPKEQQTIQSAAKKAFSTFNEWINIYANSTSQQL